MHFAIPAPSPGWRGRHYLWHYAGVAHHAPLAMPTFTAIDFETADYRPDSACALGAVLVRDGRIAERRAWLIRPPRRDFVFTYIHGIRWQDVESSPRFAGIWPELRALIDESRFLAAHNAPFDQGVLRACCTAAGIEAPTHEFLCTVQLARRTWRLPSARLPAVCAHLGIPLRHHDALSDAEACAEIAIRGLRYGTDRRA